MSAASAACLIAQIGKRPRLRLRERGRLGPAIDHVGRRFAACREIGRRPRRSTLKHLQVGEVLQATSIHRLNPYSSNAHLRDAGAPTAMPIDTQCFVIARALIFAIAFEGWLDDAFCFRHRNASYRTYLDANIVSTAARSPIPAQPLPRCALMAAVALAKRAASSGARPSLRAKRVGAMENVAAAGRICHDDLERRDLNDVAIHQP